MKSVEDAYQCIAANLINNTSCPWEELVFRTDILGKNCSAMSIEQIGSNASKSYIELGFSSVFAINDACLFLRDNLLSSSDQRIWGLTFTLYPDGKFNIKYDYDRPEWYTEEEEKADLEAERADREAAEAEALGHRLNSLGVDVEVQGSDAGTERHTFLTECLAWLRQQTTRLGQDWGLGSEVAWNLDMNAGTLRFTFEDGREVICSVQIVGTYNIEDGTFLQGWDHPSVPEPLRRASLKLRAYGEAQGMERLTARKLTCTEADAWAYAAAAAKLDDAIGAYRGRAGQAWVYMTFGEPASR